MSVMQTELLQRIQTALLTQVETEPLFEPVLPALVTDYLDTLLQTGTEFPERQAKFFDCLIFQAGEHELMTPLARIHRIEQPGLTDDFYQVAIPDCEGERVLTLTLEQDEQRLGVKAVLDVCRVFHEDVVWRAADESKRAPWFVGTHKTRLCRIFDPSILIRSICEESAGQPPQLDYI